MWVSAQVACMLTSSKHRQPLVAGLMMNDVYERDQAGNNFLTFDANEERVGI